MSDDNDETFLGLSYLEDYDLFPYNTENFAQCDPAVQLQWCLDLQSEVRGPSTNFMLLVGNAANLFVSLQPNFNGVTRGQLCTCSYQNEHGM